MEGPRPANPDEFDQVMGLINLVFRPDGPRTMHFECPLVFNPEDTENLRIVLEDGKPVSNISLKQWPIAICGCATKIGSIGSVSTHPDSRGKGYATKILHHCIDDLDVSGGSLMLISGNRGLYQRIHSTPVGKMLLFRITSEEINRTRDEGFTVKPMDAANRFEYARLYQQEAVRFVRLPVHWEKMLHVTANEDALKARVLYEIWHRDELVAYVVLGLPARPSQKALARLIEYAGSREAVAAALDEVLGECGVGQIDLCVPAHDVGMKVQAMRFGVEPSIATMPGTWKMVNLPRFMGAMWHYLEEKLGEETTRELYFSDDEGEYVMRYRFDRFTPKDGTHLMRVLFGAADEPISLDDAPGELRDIIEAIRPIPLPLPGMNAV
ncbi:MAG: GNAT family N-acetyltransferase [Planctomycetes bacterium]|nr:GNAT family N-acetyltransferase [Planctomycetota bacterium]